KEVTSRDNFSDRDEWEAIRIDHSTQSLPLLHRIHVIGQIVNLQPAVREDPPRPHIPTRSPIELPPGGTFDLALMAQPRDMTENPSGRFVLVGVEDEPENLLGTARPPMRPRPAERNPRTI